MYIEDKATREKREAERRARKFTTLVDKPQPRYGLKQFTDAFNKAAQEKIDAPIRAKALESRALSAAQEQLWEEENDAIRAFWSQPLGEMNPAQVVVDTIGEYTIGAPPSPEVKREVVNDFFKGLAENGINLTVEARERLGAFFASLIKRRGVEYSLDNLARALHRLVDLSVFTEGQEITGFAQYKHKPAPKPTVDDVLNANSTESREGNQRIKAAIELDVYGDWAATFEHYVTAVIEQFGQAMTQDELNSLGRIVVARNYNPTSLYSWSEARILGVRNGTIRPLFLTPDELLSWQVDKGEVPMNTFADRQAFQRKVAAIKNGTPLIS
jgi:hypothetical protein